MKTKKTGLMVCVLAIVLVVGVAEAQVFDDMVGHWKLDEIAGTSVLNSVTGATDGVLVGGPTWIAGQVDGAVDFDSADASDARYVECADYDALHIAGDRSVATWFKVDDWNASSWAGLITKGINADGNYNFLQSQTKTGYGSGTGGSSDGIAFQVAGQTGAGDSQQVIRGAIPVNDGEWHLAVGTYHYDYDGSGYNAGLLSIYVDGVLDRNYAVKGGLTGTNTNSVQFNGGDEAGTQGYFANSSVDDVRVYDRALSVDDVTALYDATVPEPTTMILLGLGSMAMLRRRRV